MPTKQERKLKDLITVSRALSSIEANDAKGPGKMKGLAAINEYYDNIRTFARLWKAWKKQPWTEVSKCRTCVVDALRKLKWKLESQTDGEADPQTEN